MHRSAVLRNLIVIFLAGVFACRLTQAQPSTQPRLNQDLAFLASDENEGRGIGSKGLDNAAAFIAKRFADLKLRTLPGCDDFFQPFGMPGSVSVDPKTKLSLGDIEFKPGQQFEPQGFSPDGEFSGPVVFAGYGISSTADRYDDYAGIDVKGKIVLIMRFEPHNDKGTSRFKQEGWSGFASLNSKAEIAASHGAAAVFLVHPPNFHEQEQLLPVSRGGAKSTIPFIQVTPELADQFLKQAGSAKTLAALQKDIDSTGSPASFELKDVKVSGNIVLSRSKVPVKNVLAYLPGTTRSDEFIVVGAHYDHLGRGGQGSLAPNINEIHNGADDNASGTATVMALAERLVAAGPRQRSIVFILFTGEEEGLIGSDYFVDHPPIALEKIAAMLNLDMVGRIRNEVLYVGGGGTADAFEAILDAADKASPLELKSIGKGGRGPSDHQTFAMKHIPVLFFFSGMHPDYHRPTDDIDKINFSGMHEAVDLSWDVLKAMADMPKQEYVAKFDGEARPNNGVGSGGVPVSLGVVPDYGTDESTVGVRITGTSPGSPAEKAGLKDGDIVVQIGNKKIANLYDLTDFLASAKPGDEVTITYVRGGQRIGSRTTLVERKGGS